MEGRWQGLAGPDRGAAELRARIAAPAPKGPHPLAVDQVVVHQRLQHVLDRLEDDAPLGRELLDVLEHEDVPALQEDVQHAVTLVLGRHPLRKAEEPPGRCWAGLGPAGPCCACPTFLGAIGASFQLCLSHAAFACSGPSEPGVRSWVALANTASPGGRAPGGAPSLAKPNTTQHRQPPSHQQRPVPCQQPIPLPKSRASSCPCQPNCGPQNRAAAAAKCARRSSRRAGQGLSQNPRLPGQ